MNPIKNWKATASPFLTFQLDSKKYSIKMRPGEYIRGNLAWERDLLGQVVLYVTYAIDDYGLFNYNNRLDVPEYRKILSPAAGLFDAGFEYEVPNSDVKVKRSDSVILAEGDSGSQIYVSSDDGKAKVVTIVLR